MKKVLSMIMTAALVMALFSGTAFADPGNGNGHGKALKEFKEFKDMKGHWGGESVQEMQNLGILAGYADGSFQPDKALTQGELAVIISRLLEVRQVSENQDLEDVVSSDDDEATVDDDNLSDVPAWAKAAVHEGFQKHYLNLKRFHSHVQCDRLTAVVAIAKALGLEPVTDFSNNPFKDRKLISDEDYGYLLALYKAGYINGYPDGNFNPNNLLSRVQIANIIAKLLNDGKVISDDTTAPTWTANSAIKAVDVGATSVKLEWSGASDNEGVTGYKVSYEVNGADKVKNTTAKSTTITGLEPDVEYTFTVEARDAAGNWSDDGPSVEVTTDKATTDTERPSWSDNSYVTATAITAHSVSLKWSGAHDDVDVVAYKIILAYNDKESVRTVSDINSVKVANLAADEDYTFTIEAKDAAGNWSTDGPSVEITTLKEDVADTTAPTWTTDAALTVSAADSGVLTIIWPDAEDNTGVTSYKLYQDGTLIKTLDGSANSVNVSGLNSNTEYTFKVRAVDAAGNMSTTLSKTYLTN